MDWFFIVLIVLALVVALGFYRMSERPSLMDGVFSPPPRHLPPFPNAAGDPFAPPPATNDNPPNLTAEQRLVLGVMCEEYGATAAALEERTGLPRADINRIRRELRDLGLARFGPLYDEDGAGVRGSGYTLTLAGLAAQAHFRVAA